MSGYVLLSSWLNDADSHVTSDVGKLLGLVKLSDPLFRTLMALNQVSDIFAETFKMK